MRVHATNAVNQFESDVLKTVSGLSVEGEAWANVHIPDVEHGLNEHDIVIYIPYHLFTIDAKAYEPGTYRGGINQDLEWQPEGKTEFRSVGGRLARPFGTAMQKAKKLASFVGEVSRQRVGLKWPPKELTIKSLIVVPGHAKFDLAEHTRLEKYANTELRCHVVSIDDLEQTIKVPSLELPADKRKPVEDIVEGLIECLSGRATAPDAAGGFYVGDVRLLELLKRADGTVPYEVWRGERDREPALAKVYYKYPWREASADFFFKLEKQCYALRSVRLPRIVGLHDVVDSPTFKAVIFEWLDHQGTLHDAVKARDGLPEDEAVAIVSRVAEAVAMLHENPGRQPVICRSLTPDCIFIGKGSGQLDWHTVDFWITGLEKSAVGSRSSAGVTGVSEYDAPEMSGTEHIDRRKPTVDVYSLGRLLEFCLLGRLKISGRGIGWCISRAYSVTANTTDH